jgi:hypothetical protein
MQYVPTGSSNITGTATASGTAATTKNRKKANDKTQVGLGDAENLLVYGIPASQVKVTHFYPILDSMVRTLSLP